MPSGAAPRRSWVIILVDDDRQYLEIYKKGLATFSRHAEHVEMLAFPDARDALEFSIRLRADADVLWILDSMMPCDGELSVMETRDGLLTGIVLLRKIRAAAESEARHRFLVVTNYDVDTITRELDDIPTVGIYPKLACSPKQLARLVDQEIDGNAKVA
jgi:hypothetical protein